LIQVLVRSNGNTAQIQNLTAPKTSVRGVISNFELEKNDEPARFNICIYGILGAFLLAQKPRFPL
jgi:hypothetical protein